jgi:hypothetical protein
MAAQRVEHRRCRVLADEVNVSALEGRMSRVVKL